MIAGLFLAWVVFTMSQYAIGGFWAFIAAVVTFVVVSSR